MPNKETNSCHTAIWLDQLGGFRMNGKAKRLAIPTGIVLLIGVILYVYTAPYAGNFVVVDGQRSAFVVTEDKTCCDSSDECC